MAEAPGRKCAAQRGPSGSRACQTRRPPSRPVQNAGSHVTSPGVNASDAADPNDLTAVVEAARRGLRRDVSRLVDALDGAELLIPLARDIDAAPEGERIEIEGELKLRPHLLVDPEGRHYAA